MGWTRRRGTGWWGYKVELGALRHGVPAVHIGAVELDSEVAQAVLVVALSDDLHRVVGVVFEAEVGQAEVDGGVHAVRDVAGKYMWAWRSTISRVVWRTA